MKTSPAKKYRKKLPIPIPMGCGVIEVQCGGEGGIRTHVPLIRG
jgi:hypothetical protein